MKKLLTSTEMFANCENVYNEDYTAFEVKGEPRGKMKQCSVDWQNEADYVALKVILKQFGLDDYFDMMLDEDRLYMRIIEED